MSEITKYLFWLLTSVRLCMSLISFGLFDLFICQIKKLVILFRVLNNLYDPLKLVNQVCQHVGFKSPFLFPGARGACANRALSIETQLAKDMLAWPHYDHFQWN